MKNTPLIVAHRGWHAVPPENSIPAFQAAVEAGFRWVECDVHAAVDGTPIILHDAELDRMTNTHGNVADFTVAELRQVKLKLPDGQLTSAYVPTLQEAVTAAGQQALWLVEVKPKNSPLLVEKVLKIFEPFPDRLALQSFDLPNMDAAWEMNPKLNGAVLVESAERLVEANERNYPAIHARHDLLTSDFVNSVHQRGGLVGAWTVNKLVDLRRIIGMGANAIITDFPDRLREMLERNN